MVDPSVKKQWQRRRSVKEPNLIKTIPRALRKINVAQYKRVETSASFSSNPVKIDEKETGFHIRPTI